MIQRSQHLGLALEPAHSIRVAEHAVGQDLQRDIAVQRGVARAIDFAHSARADKGENLVRSEARSDRESHEWMRDYTGWSEQLWQAGTTGRQRSWTDADSPGESGKVMSVPNEWPLNQCGRGILSAPRTTTRSPSFKPLTISIAVPNVRRVVTCRSSKRSGVLCT